MLNSVLVDIVPAESATQSDKDDVMYLWGNIDLLVGDAFTRIGPCPGALLLLPSVEELAAAIRRLRGQETIIEVLLVGDSPSLWFLERKVAGDRGIVLAYRGVESLPVSRESLDIACGEAIGRFVENLRSQGALRAPSHGVSEIVSGLEKVWPGLSPGRWVR